MDRVVCIWPHVCKNILGNQFHSNVPVGLHPIENCLISSFVFNYVSFAALYFCCSPSSCFLIWLFQLISYLVFSCVFLLAGFIAAAEIHNLWFLWQDQGWVSIPPSTIPQVQTETLTCTLAHKHKYKGETVTYPSLISAALCNKEYISRLYMYHLVFFFIEHICNSSYNVKL